MKVKDIIESLDKETDVFIQPWACTGFMVWDIKNDIASRRFANWDVITIGVRESDNYKLATTSYMKITIKKPKEEP